MDKDNSSAVSGSGCLCRQAFYEPEFGCPLWPSTSSMSVKETRTSGAYPTYAPLDLRPDDTFSRRCRSQLVIS